MCMTPELFDLLCALGRSRLSDADRARVDACARTAGLADAPANHPFLSEALSAGLMPLAYRHLVAAPSSSISVPLAQALVSAFHRHAAGAFRPAQRLGEILERLAAHGVDARAYKGPALAVDLYGNFAMRQYGDLDVLVRPRDADAAAACLTAEGFSTPPGPAWTAFAQAHRRHERSFIDPETGMLLELHWALADPFDGADVNVDWLMAEPGAVDLIGRRVLTIGAERSTLALAVHGARHVWARFAWLVDLAESVRRHPSFDWDVALGEARRIGGVRSLAASFAIAHELIDAPLPLWVRRSAAMDRAAVSVRQRLMCGREGKVETADLASWRWMAAEGLTGRASLVWRAATTPSLADMPDGQAWPDSRWRVLWRRGLRLMRVARTARGGNQG
jgi:hypothetical protein